MFSGTYTPKRVASFWARQMSIVRRTLQSRLLQISCSSWSDLCQRNSRLLLSAIAVCRLCANVWHGCFLSRLAMIRDWWRHCIAVPGHRAGSKWVCYRCKGVPFSNKHGVAGPRSRSFSRRGATGCGRFATLRRSAHPQVVESESQICRLFFFRGRRASLRVRRPQTRNKRLQICDSDSTTSFLA